MENQENTFFFKKLNFLLFVTSLSAATSWLPFIRGISDGESYEWGTTFLGTLFHGKGVTGDFYFVFLNMLLVILLMYSFYWIRNRKIFYSLLGVWYGSIIANAIFEVFKGERYMFHGDTLNVHVDLTFILIPLILLLGAFVLYVVHADRKHRFTVKRHRKNRIWAMLLLLPIPIQIILFNMGEPHGITDQIGVVIALVQVALFWKMFEAYNIISEDI